MELGRKIYQLRKLSGMTQEQLAEKLSISRQTLSKWENETGVPDVESVVKISTLFHVSLEELLLEEGKHVEEEHGAQITLEDMAKINAHNRKMNLLLSGGLLFLAIGILTAVFERMLKSTTLSLSYILYRYMVTGHYEYVPVDYTQLLVLAVLAGTVGLFLCLCYFIHGRKN